MVLQLYDRQVALIEKIIDLDICMFAYACLITSAWMPNMKPDQLENEKVLLIKYYLTEFR